MTSTQTVRIRCGRFTVAWVVRDTRMAVYWRAAWHRLLTERPAHLVVVCEPLPSTTATPTSQPMMVQAAADEQRVEWRFGTLARVTWRVGMDQMVCGYDARAAARMAMLAPGTMAPQLLAAWLAQRDVLVLHAAGILTDGAVDLFVGPSGAGKTTLARSVDAARVLHDDQVLLWCTAHRDWMASPAPWRNDAWAAQAVAVWPVARLFLLAREGASGVHRLANDQALQALVRAGWPAVWSPRVWQRRFAHLANLIVLQPCYSLRYHWPVEDPWPWIVAAPSRRDRSSVSITDRVTREETDAAVAAAPFV